MKLKMDKDRKKILDRRAKGRAEALGKDKGKAELFQFSMQIFYFSLKTLFPVLTNFFAIDSIQ